MHLFRGYGGRPTLLAAVAASALLQFSAVVSPAFAQSVGDQTDPTVRLPPPDEPSTAVPPAQPSAQCPFAGPMYRGPDYSFVLSGVQFQGMRALTPEQAAPAYAHLVGSTVNLGEMCVVADRLREIYRDNDMRLVLIGIAPQQLDKAGTVFTFTVTEAVVGQVEVAGDPGPVGPLVLRTLDRLRGRDPLYWSDVERYVLLAGDIPSVGLETVFRAGATPGTTDLTGVITRDRFDGFLGLQNWGSEEIGRMFLTGGVSFSGLTEFGDRQYVAISTSLDEDKVVEFSGEQFQAAWLGEVRVGTDGLTANAELGYSNTRPGGEVGEIEIESETVYGAVGLVYPVIRSQRVNLNVAAGLDIINQDNSVLDQDTLSRDRLRIAYLGAAARYVGQTGAVYQLGNRREIWSLTGSVELRQGLEIFDGSSAGDPQLSRFGADPEALLIRFDAALNVPVADWAMFRVRTNGQYSDDALVAYEEYAVGTSQTTVGRGYDPAVVAGDSGLGVQAELRLAVPRVANWLDIEAFAFYDVARIHQNDAVVIDESRTLASWGGGFAFVVPEQDLSLELMWAEPLDKPLSISPAVPDGRLLFNIRYQIF